ncbi:hypothetical protein AOR13_2905 [Alteromonas stellipolaris LMG 21856]|nr:hypothetical protein AOR13_2905 [Alteromonas stellipolaris LMG 21856]
MSLHKVSASLYVMTLLYPLKSYSPNIPPSSTQHIKNTLKPIYSLYNALILLK